MADIVLTIASKGRKVTIQNGRVRAVGLQSKSGYTSEMRGLLDAAEEMLLLLDADIDDLEALPSVLCKMSSDTWVLIFRHVPKGDLNKCCGVCRAWMACTRKYYKLLYPESIAFTRSMKKFPGMRATYDMKTLMVHDDEDLITLALLQTNPNPDLLQWLVALVSEARDVDEPIDIDGLNGRIDVNSLRLWTGEKIYVRCIVSLKSKHDADVFETDTMFHPLFDILTIKVYKNKKQRDNDTNLRHKIAIKLDWIR